MKENIYVVKQILDVKIKNGIKLYKIWWDGYDINDFTWEPKENLN